MDPLSALSIAAAVLQFVDFGTKLVGVGREIYESVEGATEENIHSEFLASHAKELATKVREASLLRRSNANGSPLGQNDATVVQDIDRLRQLAERCEVISHEILEVIRSIQKTSSFQSWTIVRRTVKSLWNGSKIASLQKRLEAIKSEMSLSLLCMIRDEQSILTWTVRDTNERCKSMQVHQELSLDRLRDEIKSELSSQGHTLVTIVDSLNKIRDAEVLDLASNDSMKDQLRTDLLLQADLTGLPISGQLVSLQADSARSLTLPQLFAAAASLHYSSIDLASAKFDDFLAKSDHEARCLRILESLRYEEMGLRHFEITDAYPTTYAWIFEPEKSPFATWLQHSSDVFWICGKPGSGKSTIMKYLSQNTGTADMLEAWSGLNDLVWGTHFFWSTGTRMQKSQQGLLQGLLFQVLRAQPHLIEAICPARWNADDTDARARWTVDELGAGLEKTLSGREKATSFCFFLDGLDEYAEDQYLLIADMIQYHAQKPNVKFCVSSRPHNVFAKAFGKVPERMLTLQDFTVDDMDRVVRGKLELDRRFRILAAEDDRAVWFAQEIRRRASGVFLWVHVVITQLLSGLNEDDDIPTLQARLDELPTEMIALYKHIIDQLDPVYKLWSTRALLIAHEAPEPLPFMVYWFLNESVRDPEFQSKLAIGGLSRDEIRIRRQEVSKKISSWCKGLLEVVRASEHASWNTWEPLRAHVVDFHHRTVKDFLQTSDMEAFLRQSAGRDFDARRTLADLFVAQAKIVNVQFGLEDEMKAYHFMASEAEKYAKSYGQVRTAEAQACLSSTSKQLEHVEAQLRKSRLVLTKARPLQVAEQRDRSRSNSSERPRDSSFLPFLRKLAGR